VTAGSSIRRLDGRSMAEFQFAMWTLDHHTISLDEVIARLPPNEWSWTGSANRSDRPSSRSYQNA
jgi:hypothetical protein